MWFGLISLFPQMFESLEVGGIVKRAKSKGLVDWACVNPRDLTVDPHKTVDDRPYGGGPGMVLKPEPLTRAVRVAKLRAPSQPTVICLSPAGKPLTQQKVKELSTLESIVLVCGRYEGIDQRFIDNEVDELISIGDYILSGGELAAMVLVDAITRLLPGAVSKELSVQEESFSKDMLDWPQYTRPEIFKGQQVPDVLLSGDHNAIKNWRQAQAFKCTQMHRPDLLECHEHN